MSISLGITLLVVFIATLAILAHIRLMKSRRIAQAVSPQPLSQSTESSLPPRPREGFDNLSDIQKLKGGTAHFAVLGIAYVGDIDYVEYVPLGPGAINLQLLSVRAVTEGPDVPDIPLFFCFSLFLAEVENRKKELIINSLVPQHGMGSIVSLRVKE